MRQALFLSTCRLMMIAALAQCFAISCSQADFKGASAREGGDSGKDGKEETNIDQPVDVAGGYGLACTPSSSASDPKVTDFGCALKTSSGIKFVESERVKLNIAISINSQPVSHTIHDAASPYNFSYSSLTVDAENTSLDISLIDTLNANAVLYSKKQPAAKALTQPLKLFVSQWKVRSSASSSITLPIYDGGNYDFVVDWGDGSRSTIATWNDPQKVHTYASPLAAGGIYNVTIAGLIDGFNFNEVTIADPGAIDDISQFGPLKLGNRAAYFRGAVNLKISATDALDLSQTTDLSRTFDGCTSLSSAPSLRFWDMSNVTNIGAMFRGATNFNENISGWNTSNLVGMEQTFNGASKFNQNIGKWDVSRVTNMSALFENALEFNQDIGGWNVASANKMPHMFRNARNFNQDIGGWNVANVVNFQAMFNNAASFNQNLARWDLRAATAAAFMFDGSGLSSQNYSALLNALRSNPNLKPNVNFGALGTCYLNTASAAHDHLENSLNWTIIDDRQCP